MEESYKREILRLRIENERLKKIMPFRLLQVEKTSSVQTNLTREKMIELVKNVHKSHRTHGYRWVAAYIRINEHIEVSDSYVYKCFRFLGIRSEW